MILHLPASDSPLLGLTAAQPHFSADDFRQHVVSEREQRLVRVLDCDSNFIQTVAVVQKPHFYCDVRASFAAAFRTWRRKKKVPLKKIAKDLGVSISTVNSWELGERFPGGYNFEMLVEYTGLPPCKLFCVMADKCIPDDCLLALSRIASNRS